MYHRILLPLDRTQFSESEVEHALKLLSEGGQLLLLSVVGAHPLTAFPAEALTSTKILQSLDEEQRTATEYLTSLSKVIKAKRADLTIETVLGQGGVDESIVETARKYKAELVIVTQSQKSSLERLFTHSTSENLINTLEMPVLVVHNRTEKVSS